VIKKLRAEDSFVHKKVLGIWNFTGEAIGTVAPRKSRNHEEKDGFALPYPSTIELGGQF